MKTAVYEHSASTSCSQRYSSELKKKDGWASVTHQVSAGPHRFVQGFVTCPAASSARGSALSSLVAHDEVLLLEGGTSALRDAFRATSLHQGHNVSAAIGLLLRCLRHVEGHCRRCIEIQTERRSLEELFRPREGEKDSWTQGPYFRSDRRELHSPYECSPRCMS